MLVNETTSSVYKSVACINVDKVIWVYKGELLFASLKEW